MIDQEGLELNAEPEEESFEKLYEESLKSVKVGSLVKGRVINIAQDYVFVDIGYKFEGRTSLREFSDASGSTTIAIGDDVDLVLERVEDREGFAILSKIRADQLKVWDDIIESSDSGKILTGKITRKVKGGFHVEIGGLPAFLPSSHLDVRPVRSSDSFLGQTYRFRVLKYDRKRSNIIVSRRAVLEEERAEQREETLGRISEGAIVKGVVKNVTDYGAFIDLGGVDGLLHITDISWGKVTHPSAVLSPGDELDLMILRYDKEGGKISLGLKQTKPDPWLTVVEKYPVGSRIEGKVVNIVDYGAFVEIEEGLEGLIHISELSWTKVRHPSQKVKVGDTVEVVVLGVEPDNRRISLGLKQLEENPWNMVEEKYPKGSRIKGVVKNITDFGMFVGIEEGIDGLVHISDLSWRKVKHPSELYKKDQEVEAVVLNIDKGNERFSLGIRQLESDPWSLVADAYKPGMVVSGRVTGMAEFGAFVELEEGVEGLVHISEINRGKKKGMELEVGDLIETEILNVDLEEKKIGLSIRGKVQEEEAPVEEEGQEESCPVAGEADRTEEVVAAEEPDIVKADIEESSAADEATPAEDEGSTTAGEADRTEEAVAAVESDIEKTSAADEATPAEEEDSTAEGDKSGGKEEEDD
ncbi:MAG: 30S ribosomal protein S1 [Zetaproteobacteria bacterium]|nr:30S ribosomal protein S1 [Zetaproteobacteria bacterium]